MEDATSDAERRDSSAKRAMREDIVRAIAREMCTASGIEPDHPYVLLNRGDVCWQGNVGYAEAALAAIIRMGHAVVPREADESLALVGGQTEGMTRVNDALAYVQTRSCSVMSFPGEGWPLQQAWRAMVMNSDVAK